MDIRLIISNLAAAGILLISVVSLVSGHITGENVRLLDIMIGASLTYLFTENMINGRSKKDTEVSIPGVDDA